MLEIIAIVIAGAIVGALVTVLALALCRMASRCSPREQAAMDNEQAKTLALTAIEFDRKYKEAVSGNEKWEARIDAQREGE